MWDTEEKAIKSLESTLWTQIREIQINPTKESEAVRFDTSP